MLIILLAAFALAADPPDSSDDDGVIQDDEASAIERRPVRASDVALAVPRAVLFVPRAATTLAFLPIRPLIRWGADHNVPGYYRRFVYWNEDETFGLRPRISYDNNFGPTVGASLFHDSLFGNGEEANLTASFGGSVVQSYEGRIVADRLGGAPVWTDVWGRYERNPNVVFAGFGSEQLSPVTRYSQTRWLGLAAAGVTLGRRTRQVQLGGGVIFNDRDFGPSQTDKQVSIEEEYDTSTLAGFDTGVTTVEVDAIGRLDFMTGGLRSRGVYAEAFGGPMWTDIGDPLVHYGFEFHGATPLFRGDRLVFTHLFVEALDGDDVPFTALPRLGGVHRLRGYRADRFRDRRAASATLGYSWPVHKNVQAQAFLDVGSTSDTFDNLFDTSGWRSGGGLSLLLGSESGVDARLDLAVGEGFFVGVGSDFQRVFRQRGTRL